MARAARDGAILGGTAEFIPSRSWIVQFRDFLFCKGKAVNGMVFLRKEWKEGVTAWNGQTVTLHGAVRAGGHKACH